MNNQNNQMNGYNQNTGQPIYENNVQQIPNQNYPSLNNNLQYNNYNNYKKSKKSPILVCVLLLLLVVVGIFIIFNKNSNKSRTIMIYMAGADLESENGLATSDLNGINYDLMDNKNINVVLIAGGAKKWNNSYIDISETSIYELKSNGFEKIKKQELKNMGKSGTLIDFLDYVYDNYKTDEYDLIFWNHGAAILGSEHDEISDDILNLYELKNAMANSKFGSLKKLETIIFRTCLNGTIEVANVFKDYAKYFVASEEITIGSSVDNVLGFINEIKTTDDGYDLGLKFINSYKKQTSSIKDIYEYLGQSETIYSTYSIIDLKKIDELTKSVNEFFEDINKTSNYNEIAKVRSNLYQYALDEPSYDMVDLYNLVNELKSLSPDKANKVFSNFEQTVMYNWATNSKSRGISIYFPFNGEKNIIKSILTTYSSFNELSQYNKFIGNFNSIRTTSYKNYSFLNNDVNINKTDENADFTLELTDEQKDGYAKAEYIVFRDNKDGYYLPIYSGKEVSLNGNTLNANIKNKQLKLVDKSDNTGEIITLEETDVTDEYIKYNTVAILESFSSDFVMDIATISLIYDRNDNDINIGGVFLKSKNENLPSGTVAADLKNYEYVSFGSSKYKILDDNGNYTENWDSNGVIEGFEVDPNNIEFQISDLNDGYDYYCVFIIYDVDNNYYYSKLVKMN